MAGVLPGVEAARIRRIHKSNLNNGGSTRRASFCLYATNYHEFHISSSTSKIRRAGCDDEKLEAVAREAKKRLDRKFQTYGKLETTNLKETGRTRPFWLCRSLRVDSIAISNN